jgi:hypothetical protein
MTGHVGVGRVGSSTSSNRSDGDLSSALTKSATVAVDCGVVSAEEVDEYLRGVEEPKRSTLQSPHTTILEIAPEADQVISYGVPLSA